MSSFSLKTGYSKICFTIVKNSLLRMQNLLYNMTSMSNRTGHILAATDR